MHQGVALSAAPRAVPSPWAHRAAIVPCPSCPWDSTSAAQGAAVWAFSKNVSPFSPPEKTFKESNPELGRGLLVRGPQKHPLL